MPSEYDGGSPITEYVVEMKESTSKEFKKIGFTKGDTTFMSVSNLLKDHGYNFKITAKNPIGLSDPFEPSDTIKAGSRISKLLVLQ